MRSTFFKKYGLIILLIFFGLSFVLNQIALRGAIKGGSNISKKETFNAQIDSSSYYWETYPYALIISLGLAIAVIILGTLLSLTNKKD